MHTEASHSNTSRLEHQENPHFNSPKLKFARALSAICGKNFFWPILLAFAFTPNHWIMEINSTTEVLLSVSGALLFCLGFVLRYWSFCYEKKDRYILDGPYRYVRNPVELGNICFCIATGLILHANPFFIAAMTLLGIIYFNIISIIYENNCFLALGAMFLRYKGRVHRWIPSRLPGINRSQESLQLLRGLHQSYSSFLFFSGVLFVIALRNHLQLGEHSVRFMTKLFQILD